MSMVMMSISVLIRLLKKDPFLKFRLRKMMDQAISQMLVSLMVLRLRKGLVKMWIREQAEILTKVVR